MWKNDRRGGIGLAQVSWPDPRRGRRGTARGWPGAARRVSPGAAACPFGAAAARAGHLPFLELPMSSGFPRLELAVASTLGLSFLGFFASLLPRLFSLDIGVDPFA